MKLAPGLIFLLLLSPLAGCDKLGLDNAAAEAAREEAEGKAIGSACRQSARPLEECYQNNRRSPKAAIFAGWREMDAYMRENKIEDLKPDAKPEAEAKPVADKAAEAAAKPAQPAPAAATNTPPAIPKPAAAADGGAEPTTTPTRRPRPALAR